MIRNGNENKETFEKHPQLQNCLNNKSFFKKGGPCKNVFVLVWVCEDASFCKHMCADWL